MPFTATVEDVYQHIRALIAPDRESTVCHLSSASKEWLWNTDVNNNNNSFMLSNIQLLLTKANKSKGVMLITLTNQELVEYFINVKMEIYGRNLVCTQLNECKSEVEVESNNKSNNHHPTTVYVTRLPLSVKEPELNKLFSSFGPVVGCRIMIDKLTKQSKVSIFIVYMNAH